MIKYKCTHPSVRNRWKGRLLKKLPEFELGRLWWARDQYGKLWSGNSRRSPGLEIKEPAFQGLTIRGLGQGCTNGQTLFNRVMEVLNKLNLTADLEQVTDFKKIASFGITGSPALLINGKVVSVGQVPHKKRIETRLKQE